MAVTEESGEILRCGVLDYFDMLVCSWERISSQVIEMERCLFRGYKLGLVKLRGYGLVKLNC